MYEDVSPDYAKKTVTMEFHPHIPGPSMASIHPCKYVQFELLIISITVCINIIKFIFHCINKIFNSI